MLLWDTRFCVQQLKNDNFLKFTPIKQLKLTNNVMKGNVKRSEVLGTISDNSRWWGSLHGHMVCHVCFMVLSFRSAGERIPPCLKNDDSVIVIFDQYSWDTIQFELVPPWWKAKVGFCLVCYLRCGFMDEQVNTHRHTFVSTWFTWVKNLSSLVSKKTKIFL